MTTPIEERNIVLVYVLGFITLGIYFLYWYIKTKRAINDNFGSQIPTCWLLIIPIANLYWMYKFAEAYSIYVIKDDNKVLWALLFILVGIIAPALVQIELNKYARNEASIGKKSDRRCPNCGSTIPEDANVCPYCGKQFENYL